MSKVQKFEVGGFAYAVWGYGQTNVDFFKVVKRNEKSVWLEAVGSKRVYEGNMHGYAVPVDAPRFETDGVEKNAEGEWVQKFVQPKNRKLVKVGPDGEFAKERFGHVYPWQGHKMFFSEWY